MDLFEELNYIPHYQNLLFQDDENALHTADTKRKCLVQTHSASMTLLDNETALQLTKINLQEFNSRPDNVNLEKHMLPNHDDNKFRCSIKDIDLNDFLTPLPCSSSGKCKQFESYDDSNLKQFINLFKNSSVEDYGKQTKIRKINNEDTQKCANYKNINNENTLQYAVSSFKTAREELDVQNLKKFGTRSNSYSHPGGQKRKLGIRRTLQNKFVSPMLTNNSSGNQLPKDEEWPTDQVLDEKLKNIDPKMVELIRSEIMDSGTTINWHDIAGLEFAKTVIQEAVVWPLLRPDIFTGLRRPPKGILLFGPPGTGKTLIGKCVASQSKSTFFSISASSLTSKWIGDGEKMVRALFAVARCHQPAVIFIDEIDSLLSQRSETEHESSRRIKTEFLIQLDGATTDSEERLLLIGATNRPQELDEAARRRFVKRLYIPLPEFQARLQLVSQLMISEKHNLSGEHIEEVARLSDGFSGADMKNLCSEASLGPIRSIDMSLLQSIQSTEVRPICMDDFIKAFSTVTSSVSPSDLDHYLKWNKTYGSGTAPI